MAKDLIFWIIGIIIILIFIFPNLLKFAFIDVISLKSQLKQEYTTIWADETDGSFNFRNWETDCPNIYGRNGVSSSERTAFENKVAEIKSKGSGCAVLLEIPTFIYFETDKFIIEDTMGYFYTSPEGRIGLGANNDFGRSSSLLVKQAFKGQEVVVIARDTRVSGAYIGEELGRGEDKALFFKPHTLNPNIIDVCLDKSCLQKVREVNADSDGFFRLRFSYLYNSPVISYIGYKAQFSCDLSPNERWIQTQWLGSVNINDVIQKDGFIPTKFCKETRPFILRDIQQGETSIFPDPIPDFNRGCFIPNTGDCKTPKPLPTNQFIVVNYAVYQAPGLENPTTGTQAYKCIQRDSNYKCLGWVIEEVIKPVEVVVQCQQNSDCPLPLTQFQDTSCLGYFKGCINKKCVYDNTILDAPKCQNQVITIVKQIQEVDKRTVVPITGINTFTFTQNKDRNINLNIGDKSFSTSLPQFICTTNSDTINPPNPSSNCWQSTINFDGKSFPIKDNQEITIHPLINVRFFASGTYVINPEFKQAKDTTPFRNDDWGNTFVFTIDTENALNLNAEDSSFVLQNSNKQIKLTITNNLPSGTALIKSIQEVRQTNQILPEQKIEQKLNSGINQLSINLDTSNLGINQLEIQIFYEIQADNKVLIPSNKFILNYNIVTKLPAITEIVKIVEVEKIGIKKVELKKKFKLSDIPIFVWIIVGIIIFLLLIRRRD